MSEDDKFANLTIVKTLISLRDDARTNETTVTVLFDTMDGTAQGE